MQPWHLIAAFAGGLLTAALAAWLVGRSMLANLADRIRSEAERDIALAQERFATATRTADDLRTSLTRETQRANDLGLQLADTRARAEKDREAAAEKLALLEQAEVQLKDAFSGLSKQALASNSESFLQLAQENLSKFNAQARGDLEKRQQAVGELVKPLTERLKQMGEAVEAMERRRAAAYEGVTEQIRQMLDTGNQLRRETGNLVTALRAPQVRGRWGEMQLRRTVELAGMVDRCDFFEQVSTENEDAQRLRPDMVVHLPENRRVVVDAKAPLAAYLEALDAADADAYNERLEAHARQVREHIKQLSSKQYWTQFESAPEFVVLFLPGEVFLSAALQKDPTLLEFGPVRRVIPATPTTLIALLKAVAYGWQQTAIEQEAREICKLGLDLHKRIGVMAGHFDKLRRGLDSANKAYNDAIGSLERNVLPGARKFQKFEAIAAADLPELEGTEHALRTPAAPELTLDAPTVSRDAPTARTDTPTTPSGEST